MTTSKTKIHLQMKYCSSNDAVGFYVKCGFNKAPTASALTAQAEMKA